MVGICLDRLLDGLETIYRFFSQIFRIIEQICICTYCGAKNVYLAFV